MSWSPLSWMLENLEVGKNGTLENRIVIVDDRAKSPSKTLLRRISKDVHHDHHDAENDIVISKGDDHSCCDDTVESMELPPLVSPLVSKKTTARVRAAASPDSVIMRTSSLDDWAKTGNGKVVPVLQGDLPDLA
ncbi:MAG: hypothetical protein SGBAC_008750 [Bacillariaceae sp.]